jgi:Zn-finger nucleic acid-binding protein
MPDTRLCIAGNEKILMADDIPALNHFFKIRDDPMWKIRRMCPVCHEWLVVQDYEGLTVMRCAFCDGFMIEKEKLPRIFVRQRRERRNRICAFWSKQLTDGPARSAENPCTANYTVMRTISRSTNVQTAILYGSTRMKWRSSSA